MLSPDDTPAWRRRWWQPASANRTQRSTASQSGGQQQKVWFGEEAEPQGLPGAIGSRLSVQPGISEDWLQAFQRESWGCKWEVRERGGSQKNVSFPTEGLGWVFSTGVKTESDVTPSLFLLTEIRSEVLTVLYQYSLLQSTFRSASIHVSSTIVWAKGLLPILLLTCDSN